MNGKNLNVQYRRNSYAKKRIKVIAVIVCIVLVLLAAAFLVIGGMLKDKVDEDNQGEAGVTTNGDAQTPPHAELPSVKGYGMSILGATDSAVSEKASKVDQADGSCISFSARGSSGEEIYFSSVAQSVGKQSASNSYLKVSGIVSRAKARGLRTSAVLPVSALSVEDDLERSVLLAYDAAVCAELFREGADDVVITLDEGEITEDNIDELIRLAQSVKNIDGEVLVGISLSRELLAAEDSEVLVSKLWEAYDFLAYDITSIEEGKDAREFAEENINSEVHYYILRYNMRVLFPNVESEDLVSMAEVLSTKGSSNWMTVVLN